MTKATPQRNKGRFIKGKSGNPAGRPKQQSVLIREELNKHSADVIKKVLDLALLDNDTAALKMVLDRIAPPLKPTSAPIEFKIDDGSLTEKANQILFATSQGKLSTEAAGTLITALGNIARITELDELIERIAKLEKMQGGEHEC